MYDQDDDQPKKGRGFASMPKSRVKALGSKGGKASHRNDPKKLDEQPKSSSEAWTAEEDEEI